jgi:hypothetical protein
MRLNIERGPFGNYRRGTILDARRLNRVQVGARDAPQAGPGVERIQIGDSVIFAAAQSGNVRQRSRGTMIERVKSRPPLPTSGTRIIFWLGPEHGGNGDNQHWIGAAEQTRWHPLDKPTLKYGV